MRPLFLLFCLALGGVGCDTGELSESPADSGEAARAYMTAKAVQIGELDAGRQAALIQSAHQRLGEALKFVPSTGLGRLPSLWREAEVPSLSSEAGSRLGAQQPPLASSSVVEGGLPERGYAVALQSSYSGTTDLKAAYGVIINGTAGGVAVQDSVVTGPLLPISVHYEPTAQRGDSFVLTIAGEFAGLPIAPLAVPLHEHLYGVYTGAWFAALTVEVYLHSGGSPVAQVGLEFWLHPDLVDFDVRPNRVLVEEGTGTGFSISGIGSDSLPTILPDETLLDVFVGGEARDSLLWFDTTTETTLEFARGTALPLGDINAGHLGYMVLGAGPTARQASEYANVVEVSATPTGFPIFVGTGSFAAGAGFYDHVTKAQAEAEFAARCGSHPDFQNPNQETYPKAFEANARLSLNMVQEYVNDPEHREIDGGARLASGGAISDIMSAKFREAFPTINGGNNVVSAKKDVNLLAGSYNVRSKWIFAPQYIVTSLAQPGYLAPSLILEV